MAGPADADGRAGDIGQLDALRAKLPEHVNTELLAQIKAGETG